MLQRTIPAEILNDKFHAELVKLAQSSALRTYLEIGSSSGEGSTSALAGGIRARSDKANVRLFCMEVSKERANTLQSYYAQDEFVRCYNVSSIPSDAFPDEGELEHFFFKVRYPFKPRKAQRKFEEAQRGLKVDLDYLREHGADGYGIRQIKQENQISNFDFVLIDGSEYAGERELMEVMGAKVIALDDIQTFKCWTAHRLLLAHPGYRLVSQSKRTRNGFSIFERRY